MPSNIGAAVVVLGALDSSATGGGPPYNIYIYILKRFLEVYIFKVGYFLNNKVTKSLLLSVV